MKKFLAIFCLLFIILASCTKEHNIFATLKGRVIDVETTENISGATVTLSPSDKSTLTDSNGCFEFADLDARQYTITVQKQGYITNRKSIIPNPGETVEFTITLKKL